MKRFLAAAVAAVFIPLGAHALTLDATSGFDVALPDNFNPNTGAAPAAYTSIFGVGTTVRSMQGLGAFTPPINFLSPHKVAFTYLGKEAGFSNNFEFAFGTQRFNTNTSSVGDVFGPVTVDAGPLDFGFTSDNGVNCTVNHAAGTMAPAACTFAALVLGDRAVLFFGDGTGDSDYDDMVIGLQAATVPLPPAAVLLLGGVACLAGASRFRRRA